MPFYLAHSIRERVVLELWRVLDDRGVGDPRLEGRERGAGGGRLQQGLVALEAAEK